MPCKTPLDLYVKEYQDTGKVIRKNAEKGRPLTEGVDEKRFNKVKNELSKAVKRGEKF